MKFIYLPVALLFLIGTVVSAIEPGRASVRDFGATGDGQTDDTRAFQRAIDSVAPIGGIVDVPAGTYLITSHLIVKPHVMLLGNFNGPPTPTARNAGTLLATNDTDGMDGQPFITLMHQAGIRGLIIEYPTQSMTEPRPFPWTIRGAGDNCTIRDVMLLNPWAGVDFGTNACGRHFMDGLYGQPLYRGIFVDRCFDVGRISNVHFWPFWTEALLPYTKANATAFTIARADWEYMTNCFCLGYKIGYHFLSLKHDAANAVLTNCGSDLGPLAVLVDDCQDPAGVSFVNGQIMATVHVKPTARGPVKFTACGFWGIGKETAHHAILEGKGQTSFSNCHFAVWDEKNENVPAILAKAGGLSIVGCDFMEKDKQQIQLEAGVESTIIMGNRLRGGQKIVNESKGQVEMGLNTTR